MIEWQELKYLDEDFKWFLFKHRHGAMVKGFSTKKDRVQYLTVNGDISDALMFDFTHFAEIDNPASGDN